MWYLIHPKYDSETVDYDIAILKVSLFSTILYYVHQF